MSSIDGSGVSNDQDWYEINVTSGNTEVRIDLTFSSAVSDLDLELYDASGNQIAYSWYGIDEESINVDVINPGIYYILVDTYGNYVGANYDMTWRTSSGVVLTGDDGYEVNNDLASAYDLTSNSNTPLSDIDGPGASFDEDWYKIAVSSDALRVQADLLFTHADSDLDFELYDASGNLVITSNSSTDNESIDFTVSAAGDYYLRVITFTDDSNQYSGAQYELNWIAVSPDDAQAATTTDTVSDTNKGILSGIGDIASSASSGGGGGGSLNGLLLIPFMLMGLLRRGSSLFRG